MNSKKPSTFSDQILNTLQERGITEEYLQNKKDQIRAKLPTTIGAIGELLVAADLMKLGFEVYKAFSLTASVDLIGIKGGKFYTFEVRTGKVRGKNNNLQWSKDRNNSTHFAVIVHFPTGHQIHYIPELEPHES